MRAFVALVCGLTLTASLACGAQVHVGDPAPEVAVTDWQGASHPLAEFRGSVVAVDFWATWCTVCRQALPALDALAKRRGPDGLRVLAVSIDADRAAADAFVATRLPDPSVTLLHDPGSALMSRFGAEGMPALYVIDRDGVVRLVEAGYAPDAVDRIEARIGEILGAGAAPVTPDAATARHD